MALKPGEDAEFKQLLDALVDDLVMAGVYYRLGKKLSAAQEGEYWREFSQSRTFWFLTLRSLVDATVHRLCRAYDHNKDSLNLKNFLELVRDRTDLFETERFKERLKANPHVDSLAADDRRPDPDQLAKDLEFVQAKFNPQVKRLVLWRDKFIVHRDPKAVLKPAAYEPLLFDDIEALAQEGVKIVNRYTSLFEAASNPAWMIGQDDYESVLKAVRESLEHYEANFRRDLAAASGTVEPTA
jgi:hypothetical protein